MASNQVKLLACRSHLDLSEWATVAEDPTELVMSAADLIDAMIETAGR